jgi:alkanesulfonate monooxygenase SsuD/methylene tetrahydromethanopterin reductase-like flavin-dependent oxidoreductase (luciferase family)
VISYRGRFHAIDRAGLLPQPARPIPIWFGGFTPVSLRRAARTGDGFLFGTSPGRMLGLLAQLRERLAKEGRADAEFGAARTSRCARWTPGRRWSARSTRLPGPRDYIAALETFWREVT